MLSTGSPCSLKPLVQAWLLKRPQKAPTRMSKTFKLITHIKVKHKEEPRYFCRWVDRSSPPVLVYLVDNKLEKRAREELPSEVSALFKTPKVKSKWNGNCMIIYTLMNWNNIMVIIVVTAASLISSWKSFLVWNSLHMYVVCRLRWYKCCLPWIHWIALNYKTFILQEMIFCLISKEQQ